MELNGVSIEETFPHWTLETDEEAQLCQNVPIDAETQVVCQKCPPEIDCTRVGNTFESLKVPSGYWQSSKAFTILWREDAEPRIVSTSTGDEFYVEDCSIATKAEFCLSSDNISNWDACEEGMEGALCGMCIRSESFSSPLYHRGVDGKCAQCEDNGANLVYFLIFVVGLFILCLVLFFRWQQILSCLFQSVDEIKSKGNDYVLSSTTKCEDKDDQMKKNHSAMLYFKTNADNASGGSSSIRVKMKILVSVYQIVLSFVGTFHLNWPVTFFSMVNVIGSLLNFDVVSIPLFGCLTEHSYLTTFYMVTILPMLLCLLILLAQKAWVTSGRSEKRFSEAHAESSIFFVLFLVYPRTSQVILSLFNCYQIADGSEYVLACLSAVYIVHVLLHRNLSLSPLSLSLHISLDLCLRT